MLWYSKLHAAIIVLCTWFVGFFVDNSVPYFPIEISRTGTGPWSSIIFKWGAVSLAASLYVDEALHLYSSAVPIWICIMIIAWFPDHSHLFIHGLGVVLLMFCVFVKVIWKGDVQKSLPIILSAIWIEWFRIFIKGFVVLFTELDRAPWDWKVYWEVITNSNGLRNEMVEQVMNIMFKGIDYTIVPKLTIPIMRVTGVMQWLGLYLMMCLY